MRGRFKVGDHVRLKSTPSEVQVQPVTQDISKGFVRFLQGSESDSRVGRIQLERERQSVEHSLGENIMRQSFRPCSLCGTEQGGSKETHFDEIVEMPRLKRSVLPVVTRASKAAR
jgi:hypothetical protein